VVNKFCKTVVQFLLMEIFFDLRTSVSFPIRPRVLVAKSTET